MKRRNAAYDTLSLCADTLEMDTASQTGRAGMYLSFSRCFWCLCLSFCIIGEAHFSEMEGIYRYTTSEGYDDFLKERGVPWIGRKLIIAAPIQLEVGQFLLLI